MSSISAGFDFLRCPCSGTGPGCGGGVPLAGAVSTTGRLSTLSTMNALAALGAGVGGYGYGYGNGNGAPMLASGVGVGAAPLAAAYAPAVQLHEFEPAFYTPEPVIASVPYSPTYVAAVAPVVINGGGGSGGGSAAATLAQTQMTPTSPFQTPYPMQAPRVATPCGCCSSVFSPLPPNGFQAWRQLIEETTRPYEQVRQCGYTTGCAGLRQW